MDVLIERWPIVVSVVAWIAILLVAVLKDRKHRKESCRECGSVKLQLIATRTVAASVVEHQYFCLSCRNYSARRELQ